MTKGFRGQAIMLAGALAAAGGEDFNSQESLAQLRLVAETTLALLDVERPRCPTCPLHRPGTRRALANLANLLADASEHAEYLAGLTGSPLLERAEV
jgi:hypothetical protein